MMRPAAASTAAPLWDFQGPRGLKTEFGLLEYLNLTWNKGPVFPLWTSLGSALHTGFWPQQAPGCCSEVAPMPTSGLHQMSWWGCAWDRGAHVHRKDSGVWAWPLGRRSQPKSLGIRDSSG